MAAFSKTTGRLSLWANRFGMARLRSCVSGATAVEYGLLAGLVAIGIAGGIGALADLVNGIFEMLGETSTEVSENIDAN